MTWFEKFSLSATGLIAVIMLVTFLVWNLEGGRTAAFTADLPTSLRYYGDSPETRTSGFAIVTVPSGIGTREDRTALRCDLSHDEYDRVFEDRQYTGDYGFVRWRVWRGNISEELRCALNPRSVSDLPTGLSADATLAHVHAEFLMELEIHDNQD